MQDIAWLRPDGTLMQPEDWDSGFGRAIGVFLNGLGIQERDRRGERIRDRHFIILFNGGDDIRAGRGIQPELGGRDRHRG